MELLSRKAVAPLARQMMLTHPVFAAPALGGCRTHSHATRHNDSEREHYHCGSNARIPGPHADSLYHNRSCEISLDDALFLGLLITRKHPLMPDSAKYGQFRVRYPDPEGSLGTEDADPGWAQCDRRVSKSTVR